MKLKKVRILLINDYADQFGGAENAFLGLEKLLRQEGAIVYTLASIKGVNGWFFGGRLFNIKIFLIVLYKIFTYRIDFVWVHNCSRKISVSPVVASALMRRKILMTLHDFHLFCPKTYGIFEDNQECKLGFNSRCFLYKCKTNYHGHFSTLIFFLKWLKVGFHKILIAAFVDVFLCPSRKLIEVMPKNLCLPLSKFFYFPNFVDYPTQISKERIESNKFLFIGRISHEKGLEILVNAVDRMVTVGNSDFSVHIIGDGPDKKRIENIIKNKGLCKYFFFYGNLSHSEVLLMYSNYLALVVPSIWMENNPLVILESMAHSMPILASKVGGISDLVHDNMNGFLFGMGNHIQLADLMQNFLFDKDLTYKLGLGSKTLFENNFSKEKFLERLHSVL